MRDGTPVGTVRGSLYLPDGYIIADGSTVQRADYPRLVAFANEHNLWREETVSYTFTGTTKTPTYSSSTVNYGLNPDLLGTEITDVSNDDLAKIRIGDTLTSANLQADTTVVAIDYSRNVITINNAATTAGTKITISGSGDGRHDGLFGRGDGTETMVLPDYVNRMIQLSADNAGLHLDAGLPNINASRNSNGGGNQVGALEGSYGVNNLSGAQLIAKLKAVRRNELWDDTHTAIADLQFSANFSNLIYGNSDTVQPPAITLLPILRY